MNGACNADGDQDKAQGCNGVAFEDVVKCFRFHKGHKDTLLFSYFDGLVILKSSFASPVGSSSPGRSFLSQKVPRRSTFFVGISKRRKSKLTKILTKKAYILTSQTVIIKGGVRTFLCIHQGLTALDASRNTKLEDLYCPESQLTALDVSSCTRLKFLACELRSCFKMISEVDERLFSSGFFHSGEGAKP